MNLLTFDIEEWYINLQKSGSKDNNVEYDTYLDAILTKLAENQLKATFFCVGEMGRLFPHVIRKIQSEGHEIGCHSNIHTWLNKMNVDECREDTRCAIDSLEQCIGSKVKSYRAPAFSIGAGNTWAFQILIEYGIERDASVFPLKRDFGGFENFGQKQPCIICYNGLRLKEFPVSTSKLLGKEIVYSGGGYFRFYPYSIVNSLLEKSLYSMSYFHIGDLLPETQKVMSKQQYESYFKEKGTLLSRYLRYFKSNIGKKGAFENMCKLLDNKELKFVNMQEADKLIDWERVGVVKL